MLWLLKTIPSIRPMLTNTQPIFRTVGNQTTVKRSRIQNISNKNRNLPIYKEDETPPSETKDKIPKASKSNKIGMGCSVGYSQGEGKNKILAKSSKSNL